MDRYIRVRKIGEGSFGKALLVKRKDDGKHCVIKEINISKMGRKEREDSRKEVKVLSQMKHPNIVAYQESFEDSGSLYIVMDYCDGGDLYKKINDQRGKLFPEDQVLNWFVQLCLGLKHVHDRKILHRDIKSQNIFLTKSGVVKLGDFGIARVLNSTVELARTCIGTPYYLSPEICENRPYNNKSDVWALGCVLYELVTLKHAFEAGNMKNLVLKIVRGSYPAVSTRYSRELRTMLDSCLKHQPRQRPSVNGILRLPFIHKRIESFLSETIRAEEFSHTILHRHGGPQRAPVARIKPHPLAIAGKAVPPKLDPPPPVKKYQPASVYGGGVRKGPDDKRKNVIVRPRPRPSQPQQVARKPLSSALAARKREAEERVRQQQAQIRKQHEIEAKLQHQNFARKQSAARLQQAKKAAAQGWRATLSGGRDNLNNEQGPPQAEEKRGSVEKSEAINNEKMEEEPSKLDVQETAQRDRAEAMEAAERARVISDFQLRKREAAANKARGQAQWGRPPIQLPPHQPRANEKRGSEVGVSGNRAQNKPEENYLAKLQAIRQQNYLERKRIQQRMQLYQPDPPSRPDSAAARNIAGPPQLNLEERRRKIAALKAQADEQAEVMRKQMEEKRRQRVAPVIAKPNEPPSKGVLVEPQGKWAEPRKQWGDSPKAPVLAQQYDATGVITDETTSGIVFEDGKPVPVDPGRKQWGNEEGSPLIAMLQEKTLQTGTYAVNKEELGGQTRIDVVNFSDLPDPTPSSVRPAQQPQFSNETVTLSNPKDEGPVNEPDKDKSPCEDPKDSKDKSQEGQEKRESETKSMAEESVPRTESWVIVGEGDKVDISSSKPITTQAQEETSPHSQSDVDVHTSASVRQAWSEGQDAKKDELSGIPTKPLSEDDPGPILVQDIEEEPAEVGSKEVSHAPATTVPQAASSKDVFSTPTGPSPSSAKSSSKEKEEIPLIKQEVEHLQAELRVGSNLSASLRVGLFDTNADMLHTCSLPDLRVLFATDVGDIPGEFPQTPGEPPADDVIESTEGEYLTSQVEESSDRSSDDEGEIPSDDGEAWSGSSDEDDDDLQQLVETLQSFVEEAKSPVHSGHISVRNDDQEIDDQAPPFPITEDWEDSDDESPTSDDPSDPRSSEADSVFSRLEETRTLLESKLGLPTLLEAYQLIQTFHEDGSGSREVSEGSNNERVFPTDHLKAIIGEENTQYCPTVIHLVMADSVYAEENSQQELSACPESTTDGEAGLDADSIDYCMELETSDC